MRALEEMVEEDGLLLLAVPVAGDALVSLYTSFRSLLPPPGGGRCETTAGVC